MRWTPLKPLLLRTALQLLLAAENMVETVPTTGGAIRTEDCEHVTLFDNRTTLGEGFPGDKYTKELDVPSEGLLLACFDK